MIKKTILSILHNLGYTVLVNHDPKLELPYQREERVLQYLVPRNGPVCFDVGAHNGQTIDVFQRIFQNPIIHAFEPTPLEYETLKKKYNDSRIIINNEALADKKGELAFYTQEHSNFNSLYPLKMGENASIKVPVEKLDEYCEARGIESIDLLKIDTQGADVDVLMGAQNMLAKTKVVIIEMTLNDEYGVENSFLRTETALPGFRLYDLTKKVCYTDQHDLNAQTTVPMLNDKPMVGHVSWLNGVYINQDHFT